MVHDACRAIAGFPDALRAQVLHLIGSHHGERALGSPVEPLSIEAFILVGGGRSRRDDQPGAARDSRRRRQRRVHRLSVASRTSVVEGRHDVIVRALALAACLLGVAASASRADGRAGPGAGPPKPRPRPRTRTLPRRRSRSLSAGGAIGLGHARRRSPADGVDLRRRSRASRRCSFGPMPFFAITHDDGLARARVRDLGGGILGAARLERMAAHAAARAAATSTRRSPRACSPSTSWRRSAYATAAFGTLRPVRARHARDGRRARMSTSRGWA